MRSIVFMTLLISGCAGFPKGEICIIDVMTLTCRSPKLKVPYSRTFSESQNYVCGPPVYLDNIRKWGKKHCK